MTIPADALPTVDALVAAGRIAPVVAGSDLARHALAAAREHLRAAELQAPLVKSATVTLALVTEAGHRALVSIAASYGWQIVVGEHVVETELEEALFVIVAGRTEALDALIGQWRAALAAAGIDGGDLDAAWVTDLADTLVDTAAAAL